jgi:hypothetical protein
MWTTTLTWTPYPRYPLLINFKDSPIINLLPPKRQLPRFYKSIAVPTVLATSRLGITPEPWLKQLIADEAELPPPFAGPRVFQLMPPSPMMTQAIQYMERQDI